MTVKSLKLLGLFIGSLVLAGCSSIPKPLTADESAAIEQYVTQLTLVKNLDPAADFTQLRDAYSRTRAYDPYAVRPVHTAIEHFEQQRYSQCVEAAESTIASHFVHIQAHFLAMLCQRELGNQSAAQFHDGVVRGLLASIDQSGDGNSMSSAITTYDMQELYTYLDFMGLKAVSQELVSENNRWYDVMTVSYEDEPSEFKLYFDITRQFVRGYLNAN